MTTPSETQQIKHNRQQSFKKVPEPCTKELDDSTSRVSDVPNSQTTAGVSSAHSSHSHSIPTHTHQQAGRFSNKKERINVRTVTDNTPTNVSDATTTTQPTVTTHSVPQITDVLPHRHDGPSSRTRAATSQHQSTVDTHRNELGRAVITALTTGRRVSLNGDPVPDDKMPITITDIEGTTIEFYIRPLCPFSTIFSRFACHIHRTRSEVRFLFDGDRLSNIDTPVSKEMIGGDNIDCIWSMTGGF